MTKDKIQMSNQNEKAISYLKRKLEHYEEILKLAIKQEEAIKSENIKDLNSLITEKENHIKDIKRLDKRNPKNLISDRRLDSLLKQLHSIITKLLNYDREGIKLLSSTIDSIKTKTSNLNKKIRRIKSSRMQQIRAPRFIDVVQ